MPGYINGFIEKKMWDYEDLDMGDTPLEHQWTFVSKVHPFTGSQGDFRDIAFGIRKFSYLDPFPHKKGIPEGITPELKELILGITPWEEDLDEAFEGYMNNHGDSKSRYTTVSMLDGFKWNEGLSDENLEELRNSIKEEDYIHRDKLQAFKLMDSTGKEYHEESRNGIWYSDSNISKEEAKKLALGDEIEIKGQKLHLKRRTRKEILPNLWFELLDLLKNLKKDNEEVRLFFYWHH